MEEIAKRDKSKSHKEFKELLDASLNEKIFKENIIVSAVITNVGPKYVEADLGLKSEAFIPLSEFQQENKKIEKFDKISVLVEKLETVSGEIQVSYSRAKQAQCWQQMIKNYKEKKDIVGIAVGKVRGGFAISSNGAMAFLPNSQASNRAQKSYDELFKNQLTYAIEKLDERRRC